MAALHNHASAIDGITHINGIPLSRIEARAQPIKDNHSDPEWRCRSFSGFLAPNQSFKGLLTEDWNTVQNVLKTSHHELAHHLREIVKLALQSPKPVALIEYVHVVPSHAKLSRYSPRSSPLVPSPITLHVQVERSVFCGEQYSLFYDFEAPEGAARPENLTWKTEISLCEQRTGITLKVGGNEHAGIIRYIERYGFYEGGDANDYRIDPVLLAAFLRGRGDDRALLVMQRRGVAALGPLEEEVRSLEGQRPGIEAKDLVALESALARARTEVETQRKALEQRLAKLRATYQGS